MADAHPGRVPRGPSRSAQLLCGAGLVAGVVLSYVCLVLTPTLIAHHVVLLETLSGSISSIVTGGAYARVGREPLGLVALAPVTGIPMYGLFYWWAGRLWGDRIVAAYVQGNPRRGRWVAKAEGVIRDRGVWALIAAPFLPIPTIVVEVLCGVSGMGLGLYLVGEVVGLALWEGLLIGLGWAIGHPAVHVVNAINHYALWVTIGLVVAIVAFSAMRQWRAGSDVAGSAP
jgi:membrane protein DedA with SNARE-associated domain